MNIQEAAALAAANGTTMYRTDEPYIAIQPTNKEECCCIGFADGQEPAPYWNPCLDDLVATTWAVTERKEQGT